jgi:alanine dehydrogenase
VGVASVRSVRDVRVFSRQPGNRESFARRAGEELGLEARAVDSVEAAVTDADVVVLATRSATPVIDAAWLRAGSHVTTVGPKTVSAYECPLAVPARAAVAVTDSPAQVEAYPEPCFTDRRLEHLGAIAAGDLPGRTADGDLTFYLSTGLAGSEVVVAEALLASR